MAAKVSATDKLSALASDEAKARRGVFNLSAGGRANMLGKNELVAGVASGEVSLDELDAEMLPTALQVMTAEEQRSHVAELAAKRAEVEGRMRELAQSRDDYIQKKVDEDGGAEDSLDQKLYETITRQSGAVGLEYEDGPAY